MTRHDTRLCRADCPTCCAVLYSAAGQKWLMLDKESVIKRECVSGLRPCKTMVLSSINARHAPPPHSCLLVGIFTICTYYVFIIIVFYGMISLIIIFVEIINIILSSLIALSVLLLHLLLVY